MLVCRLKKISSSPGPSRSAPPQPYDIGNYVGNINELSDDTLMNILNNAFVPPENFDWPYTTRMSQGKQSKRYLKKEHFIRCPSLTYSLIQGGLYCRHWVLFGPSEKSGHNSGQKLGKLVKTPLISYSHMFGTDGYIDAHLKTSYHAFAMMKADDFKKRVAEPSLQVSTFILLY